MKRGLLGETLTPGQNVDRLDIASGLDFGTELGFDSAEDEMVTEYALARWARGEEEGAVRTWLSQHPHDLTSWYMILAAAVAACHRRAQTDASPPGGSSADRAAASQPQVAVFESRPPDHGGR